MSAIPVENKITYEQLEYLENRGSAILSCWNHRSRFNHIHSGCFSCYITRLEQNIKPATLPDRETVKRNSGDLLAIGCSKCPIMAQAIARIPSYIR